MVPVPVPAVYGEQLDAVFFLGGRGRPTMSNLCWVRGGGNENPSIGNALELPRGGSQAFFLTCTTCTVTFGVIDVNS